MRKWEDITKEQLGDLYYNQDLLDTEIADIYGATIGQVKYKRSKFGITFRKQVYNDFISQNNELFKTLNAESKERLFKQENIAGIAKALTHYIFRNGPVEDMHTDGKLTQDDMKTLNKYMVNHLAGIISTIYEEEWLQLELLYAHYKIYGTDWDEVEADNKELETIWNEQLNLYSKFK